MRQDELISLCKDLFTTTDSARMLTSLCPDRNIAMRFMQYWQHKDQFDVPTPVPDGLIRITEVTDDTPEEPDAIDEMDDSEDYPMQDVVRLGPDNKGYLYWIDRETNEILKRYRTVIPELANSPEEEETIELSEDIWCEVIDSIGRRYNNLESMQDRNNILEMICGTTSRSTTGNVRKFFAMLCVFGYIEQPLVNEIAKAKSNTSQSSEKQSLLIDTLYDLPYGIVKPTGNSIENIRKVLDSKLFGLAEVKQQIMDYVTLMIYSRGRGATVPILLIGDPGTGKSSIARAISEALELPFYSFSLGGASDSAVFRGHHSSWSESTPGGVVRMLITTGCCNPVVLFDEIDKAGTSNYGAIQDIVSELLDPVQSRHFKDNYLGFSLDLSRCLYILTANSVNKIPDYLLDRCEVITIRQYTPEERREIIENHLLRQVIVENFLRITVELEKEAVESLSVIPSLREVKRILRSGIARVLGKMKIGDKGTIQLSLDNVDVKGHKSKTKIGFLPNR